MGSHLVDMLVEAGHEVAVFDRFSTTSTRYVSTSVTAIVGDFVDNVQVSHALHGQEFVFHFLSFTTPVTAEGDPSLDIETNLTLTVSMLRSAALQGVRKIFFASTGGAIYGPQQQESFTENDRTLPVSPYAIVKLSIENYLRYFKATFGLDYMVFRISNPYGARQKAATPQGLIPVALHRLQAGLPIVRFGDGSMVRDYVHANDVTKMISIALAGGGSFDTYNVGRGEGHTVDQVLQMIKNVTQLNFDVTVTEMPVTFVQRSVLNMDRFRSDFGRFDYVPLEDGIARTWDEMQHTEHLSLRKKNSA